MEKEKLQVSYDATLDEVAEPGIRFFLRGKSAKASKVRNALTGLFMGAVAGIVIGIINHVEGVRLALSGLAGALAASGLNYLTFASTAKTRIRRYLKRELGQELPLPTVVTIEGGKLTSSSRGTDTTLPLQDAKSVRLEPGWIEVSFGERAIVVIPRRAFPNLQEETAFLNRLQSPSTSQST